MASSPIKDQVTPFTHVGWTENQRALLGMAHYRPEDALRFVRGFFTQFAADGAVVIAMGTEESASMHLRREDRDAEQQEDEAVLKDWLAEGFYPLGFILLKQGEAVHINLFPWTLIACVVQGRDHRDSLRELYELATSVAQDHGLVLENPWVN